MGFFNSDSRVGNAFGNLFDPSQGSDAPSDSGGTDTIWGDGMPSEGFMDSGLGKYASGQLGKAAPMMASALFSNMFKSQQRKNEEQKGKLENEQMAFSNSLNPARAAQMQAQVGRLPDYMQQPITTELAKASIARSQKADKKKGGGFWKKLGSFALKYVAPAALAMTGIGAPAAMALGAASRVGGAKLGGEGWGSALTGAAMGAVPVPGMDKFGKAAAGAGFLKNLGRGTAVNALKGGFQ